MDKEGEEEREIGVDFEVLLLEASLRFQAWKCDSVWLPVIGLGNAREESALEIENGIDW